MRSIALAIVLACATVACASSSSSAPGPSSQSASKSPIPIDLSSEAAFTEWARLVLSQSRPAWSFRTGEDALTLRVGVAEQEHQLGVGRMWDYCQSGVADCEQKARSYLDDAITNLDELSQPLAPPTAAELMPALRSASTVQSYLNVSPTMVHEKLAGDLEIVYMLDSPRRAKAVQASDLEALKMSVAQARDRALANLTEQLGTPDRLVQKLEPGSFAKFPPHYYASSLLVRHEQWAAAAARFGGQLLVSVPSNDTVLYADGRDPESAVAFALVAQDMFASAERGLSPAVLKWTAEGWIVVQ